MLFAFLFCNAGMTLFKCGLHITSQAMWWRLPLAGKINIENLEKSFGKPYF